MAGGSRDELRRLVGAFGAAEAEISEEIGKAARRGAKNTAATLAARRSRIRAVLDRLTAFALGGGEEDGPLWNMIRRAWDEGREAAERDLRNLGLPVMPELGQALPEAVRVLFAQLGEDLLDAVAFVGRRADDVLRQVVVEQSAEGAIVGRGRQKTAARIEEELKERGVKAFRDAAGREWSLSRYANMAANATMHEATTVATLTRLVENGIDLARISDHNSNCEICGPFEGKVYSITGQTPGYLLLEEAPPFHPFCLVPGQMVVAPNLLGSSERWYEGEVIVVSTASGNEITCTPNHPVLTDSGWLAAGEIVKGGHVISSLDHKRVVKSVDPNYDQMPAMIEDVARSVGVAGEMPSRSVPVAPEHFHGDGIGSEVAVVRSNRLLRHGIDAEPIGEPVSQHALGFADIGRIRLAREGTLDVLLHRLLLTPKRVVGGGRQGFALCRRHLREAKAHGFGLGADQSVLAEPVTDDTLTIDVEHLGDLGRGSLLLDVELPEHVRAGVLAAARGKLGPDAAEAHTDIPRALFEESFAHPEGIRDLLDCLAGAVQLDRVVEVERRDYSGHVYDLHTVQGWYVGNNIITHNCKHVVTAYIEGLGAAA